MQEPIVQYQGVDQLCCSRCRQEVDLHISLTHANIVKFRGACCDIRNPQPGKSAYEQDVSTTSIAEVAVILKRIFSCRQPVDVPTFCMSATSDDAHSRLVSYAGTWGVLTFTSVQLWCFASFAHA